MNKIKTILYIIVLSTFFIVDNTFWAFWMDKIDSDLVWSQDTLDNTIQNWVIIILSFVALTAVIFWIYWWFNIMMAWDNDEQVQKGKKIITYSLIWIIIIFSAWLIVNFLVWNNEQEWILTQEEEN